jgi:hypothetical protein
MVPISIREMIHPSLYREISIETACREEDMSRQELSLSMQRIAQCDRTIENFTDCCRWNNPKYRVVQEGFEGSCKDFLLRVLRFGEIRFKDADNYIQALKIDVDREIRVIDPELIGESRYDENDWLFVKIYKWILCFLKHLYFTWMDPYRIEILTARHDILMWASGKDLKELYPIGGFLAPLPRDRQYILSNLPLTEQDKLNMTQFMTQYEANWRVNQGPMNRDAIQDIHPLRLIAFICQTPRLKILLQGLFHSLAWDSFADGFIESMEKKEDLDDYMDDFAIQLRLDLNVIKPFFTNKDWKGLLGQLCQ